MPSNTIRIRASVNGGVTDVKSLINHPMTTGLQKNKKTGKIIPAHFIEQVTAELDGKQVFVANWSIGISTNPFLSFKVEGGKAGQSLKLSWVDNKGESDSITTKLS
ncbi:thiosulfate oxidation carrier complex protein SoxZ [Acidihalobacter aeolianus]|uniref:Thiosulfate oxidation carrier complex protein SoxZ n=1 Tax=Acidihalobacter aeolianus TaxID=2792603 RepID=A0A1D8K5W9_9GAMM|nr:thiosulfate oxidation carrier complex protein SoxZ [Acidihalobacter aeolianus]AOV16349.1 thiosulfate oxidation carrier complex protein SoxZ [Acidihalobacter aeolianus]